MGPMGFLEAKAADATSFMDVVADGGRWPPQCCKAVTGTTRAFVGHDRSEALATADYHAKRLRDVLQQRGRHTISVQRLVQEHRAIVRVDGRPRGVCYGRKQIGARAPS